MQTTKLLSIGDAARYLGISIDALRHRSNNGEIPCHKTPRGHRRYDRGELELWKARGKARQMTNTAQANPDNPKPLQVTKRTLQNNRYGFFVVVHEHGERIEVPRNVGFRTWDKETAEIFAAKLHLWPSYIGGKIVHGKWEPENDLIDRYNHYQRAIGALLDAEVYIDSVPFPNVQAALVSASVVSNEGQLNAVNDMGHVVRVLRSSAGLEPSDHDALLQRLWSDPPPGPTLMLGDPDVEGALHPVGLYLLEPTLEGERMRHQRDLDRRGMEPFAIHCPPDAEYLVSVRLPNEPSQEELGSRVAAFEGSLTLSSVHHVKMDDLEVGGAGQPIVPPLPS